MPSPEEEQWFTAGYLAGLSGTPIEPILAQLMPGAKDHLNALERVKVAADEETANQDKVLKRLADLSERERDVYRDLVQQVSAQESALETMQEEGGLGWLAIIMAAPMVPAVFALYQPPESGADAWSILLAIAYATLLLLWSSSMKYVPQRWRERMAKEKATVWIVGGLAVAGALLVMVEPRAGRVGAFVCGASAGLAMAFRWTLKHKARPVVTDLAEQLTQARKASSTHAAERAAAIDQLRGSSYSTVQTIVEIEGQRARLREAVARGHQFGIAIRQRKQSRRRRRVQA